MEHKVDERPPAVWGCTWSSFRGHRQPQATSCCLGGLKADGSLATGRRCHTHSADLGLLCVVRGRFSSHIGKHIIFDTIAFPKRLVPQKILFTRFTVIAVLVQPSHGTSDVHMKV